MSRGRRESEQNSEQQPGEWSELSLPVTELAEAVEFYRDSMGLEIEHEGNGYAILVHPVTGQRLSMKECEYIAQPAMSIEADDFAAQIERLVDSGAEVIDREESETFKHANVADPDGHEILVWWEDED